MDTKRTFRLKLAGDSPHQALITSRLWLATVDVMSISSGRPGFAAAQTPAGGPTPYRISRRMVVRL